jgi:hypothetical protein
VSDCHSASNQELATESATARISKGDSQKAPAVFSTHSFEQVFGKTHVVCPKTTPKSCTDASFLEVAPIDPRRNRRARTGKLVFSKST